MVITQSHNATEGFEDACENDVSVAGVCYHNAAASMYHLLMMVGYRFLLAHETIHNVNILPNSS